MSNKSQNVRSDDERILRYPPGQKTGFYRPQSDMQRMATNFDNLVLEEKSGELVPMPSMTRQSEMDACDIHNILKQHSQAGFEQLVRDNAARGQYADLTSLPDYQESLNIVLGAQAAFDALPSQVRERFFNDPSRFIEFLRNPDNQEEAIRLGLAEDTRQPDPPPQKVEIINPDPPEADKANRGVKGG